MIAATWRRIVKRASAVSLRRAELEPRARTGREGEEVAYWYLRERGFIMVARNYRPEGLKGEIDLIGWEDSTLVFIEVKTRASSKVRVPEAAVDRDKVGHLAAAAREYRRSFRCQNAPVRYDVVSIEMTDDCPRIQHFRDAFR